MDLSTVCTRDLVDELRERDNVQYVINERSSSTTVICAGRKEPIIVNGENIALSIKGLW